MSNKAIIRIINSNIIKYTLCSNKNSTTYLINGIYSPFILLIAYLEKHVTYLSLKQYHYI